jgi:hypothetical protein
MYVNVHSSIIQGSENMETASVHGLMNVCTKYSVCVAECYSSLKRMKCWHVLQLGESLIVP